MTVYAIGDVQGCYDVLMRLLDHLDFSEHSDRLWFVGDLVNRGPASLDVLRFVHRLGDRATVALGNHDLHLLAAAEDRSRLRGGDTLEPVLRAPDRDELIDWLVRQPLLHRDDALGFVMVHAGIPALWSLGDAALRAQEVETALRGPRRARFLAAMYGNEPAAWRDELDGFARLRVITNYFTRMRTLHGVCALDLEFKESANAIPAGSRPWFDDYRGRRLEARMIFGHWAALEGRCDVPGLFALDTGCVWGGRLSALRLVDAQRFSVASSG